MVQNPIAIANYFVQKSFATGKELTPMKLVKLVYIAHGWHLGLLDEPLLSESVQAWKYGPVVHSVYQEFKSFADQQITRMGTMYTPDFQIVTPMPDESEHAFLDKIWDVYKDYNGLQLSTLTHQANTPWYIVWHQQKGKEMMSAIIPDNLIREHYKAMITANTKVAA